MNPDTNVSLANAHGYLKLSRNPLLRVYRDVPMKDETTHDSEIDMSVEPCTSCDQTTDEHDTISSTRKRRRLTQITGSARSSDEFEEDDVYASSSRLFCARLLPKILMRSELLLERLAPLVLRAICFLLPWRRVVYLVSPSLEDTVDHGCHHESGETNSTHLRVGSGTRRFLSRVSSASCDVSFTSSQTLRIHSSAPSLRARTSSD